MVILIVVILSVATLSAVLPTLNSRRVSEASRILQAALSRARDIAVRTNSPQGIRLLPDPPDPSRPGVLTCSRFIEMESGDAYDDGTVVKGFDVPLYDAPNSSPGNPVFDYKPYFATTYPPPQVYPPDYVPGLRHLRPGRRDPDAHLSQPTTPTTSISIRISCSDNRRPSSRIRSIRAVSTCRPSPTSWFYNIRQGEKLQLNDSGNIYTVAGPICGPGSVPNVDRLINYGPERLVLRQSQPGGQH